MLAETVAARTREVVGKNAIASARRSRLDEGSSTPRGDVAHETGSLSSEPLFDTEGVACEDYANAVHLALVARRPGVAEPLASSESRPSTSAAPPPRAPSVHKSTNGATDGIASGCSTPNGDGSARAPRRRAVSANAVFPGDSTQAT